MTKTEHEAVEGSQADSHVDATAEAGDATDQKTENLVATVATVGIVGVGVAVFEAALLPGVVLGAVAVLAPKFVPQIGTALKPIFRSTVRGAYKISQKTKEFVAETQEHVQDIVAEVDAEVEDKSAATEAARQAAPAAE